MLMRELPYDAILYQSFFAGAIPKIVEAGLVPLPGLLSALPWLHRFDLHDNPAFHVCEEGIVAKAHELT